MRFTLVAVLVAAFPLSAAAQDEVVIGDSTKADYPMELVKRPLVLADGMIEVRLGGMSDFVATSPDSAFRTRADLVWSPFRRGQIGIQTDLMVAGGGAFEVPQLDAFFDYSLHPTMALRLGAYTRMQRDPVTDELGDAAYGFRVGVPMQWRLGGKAQLAMTPRWGVEVNGTELQTMDLDARLAYQIVSPMALYLRTGMAVLDYTFDSDHMLVPVGLGAVIHPGRLFDIGVEVSMLDVGDEAGRDSRWVFAWFALRH